MKIVLTGGGTGGHFYPLIAVAEEINRITKDEKLLTPQLYFLSDAEYDPRALMENNITFINVPAGKLRRYFSILNITDVFKTAYGMVSAFISMFRLFPDIVFSKGAYSSFPVLFAARILNIPVVIHESDSVPGKTNLWSGKFARRIAISYSEVANYFDDKKVAITGTPIRKEISTPVSTGAREFLRLEEGTPVILILGGSQGSQIINETILDALPDLVSRYEVIHQTGESNFTEVTKTASFMLENSEFKSRYKPFDHLNNLALSMSAGVADLIVTRAGSTLFEIARWGIPSIVIPITDSNGDHQRQNAFNYARTGGAIVLEENNLTPHVLVAEINRLIDNPSIRDQMKKGAKSFDHPNAAEKIAREILGIALTHEE
ncbi:MAG: UDP-N-acetylglucosamine--N-acetylmuramyl-(pentapeptide) pyrophosphoryl-undecaprenol N-acetylglucosamine transferase [Candidatus Paceibacterota bacterium]|jgi:UDP-N-acetylglucosamine--N-acetylmuramyl-(pentapeptide) pyrophosphoryl-undecaprenol N-acetylglucosamine transferase